jgi:cobalt/nickel transport system permease protein
VSGSHDQLYLAGASPLHRLAPECKLAAAILFVFTIVATPREAVWAFACFALILLVLARVGQVPVAFMARRLVIEVPFLAFAALMPIVGQGERVEVLGVSLSVAGLWAAWNIVVKATLGVATTVLMAATTPVPDILRGLERLRVPRVFVGTPVGSMAATSERQDHASVFSVAMLVRGENSRPNEPVQLSALSNP